MITLIAYLLYMILPARWLCDFDELPTELHLPGFRGRRLLSFPVAAAAAACEAGVLTAGPGFLIPAVCLIIASMSDYEYTIIPDQADLVMFLYVLVSNILGLVSLPGLPGFQETYGRFDSFDFVEVGDMVTGALGYVMSGGLGDMVTGALGYVMSGGLGDMVTGALGYVMSGGLGDMVTGALGAGGLMLAASMISVVSGKPACFAFGDVKLAAVCGALAGSYTAGGQEISVSALTPAGGLAAGVFVYVVSSILGAVYAVFSGRTEGYPFAPWIAFATAITVMLPVCIS